MNATDIQRKLTTILVEQLDFNPEEVTPDAYLCPEYRPANAGNINHLGADSLDMVELVMAVEEEFAINIPDEDAERLLTVQDWITHLEGRL